MESRVAIVKNRVYSQMNVNLKSLAANTSVLAMITDKSVKSVVVFRVLTAFLIWFYED